MRKSSRIVTTGGKQNVSIVSYFLKFDNDVNDKNANDANANVVCVVRVRVVRVRVVCDDPNIFLFLSYYMFSIRQKNDHFVTELLLLGLLGGAVSRSRSCLT